jgi:hypothetical protein
LHRRQNLLQIGKHASGRGVAIGGVLAHGPLEERPER